jgi:hypothetical protein
MWRDFTPHTRMLLAGAVVVSQIAYATSILSVLGVFGFWYADNDPPRENISGKLYKTVYAPGEAIEGEWRFKLDRPCDGAGHRWLVYKDHNDLRKRPDENDASIFAAEDDGNAELGYVNMAIRPLKVPDLISDRVELHTISVFWCNPLQKFFFPITIEYPTLTFKVQNP